MKKGVITSLLIIFFLTSLTQEAQSEVERPRFTFAVLSDIHIQPGNRENRQKFEKALLDLSELRGRPDALVINGDLTEGQKEDYEQLRQILSQNPHPRNIYFTIGNHEFYKAWVQDGETWSPETFPNGETEMASLKRFLHWIGEKKVYYTHRLNGFPFIFLGSEHYRQSNSNNREDAFLSVEQLNWLKQKLSQAVATKQPTFIFLHQPLPETVSGTYTCCLNNRAVIQHEELKKILSKYRNVFLFSGHTHLRLKDSKSIVQNGFIAINSSSVSQPWNDDDHGQKGQFNAAESEGLIVEVYDDYVWVRGRDFYRREWIKEADYKIPIKRPWYYFLP